MRKFGLIGYPLGHSFSKRFFSDKFTSESIDAQYELYPLEKIEEFKNLVSSIELSGINVTIPYKEQIMPFLNSLDAEAEAIGAVNVVKFIRTINGLLLKGFNTDAVGFEKSLKPHLNSHHKQALILGTGGASKAIDFVLRKLGLETVFVSRTKSPNRFTYNELTCEIMQQFLVVVNASPVGTFPNIDACPAIPYEFLGENHLLFDVVYNPAETLFMRKGREHGAIAVNGEQMLVEQALAAWKIWNEHE